MNDMPTNNDDRDFVGAVELVLVQHVIFKRRC